jgi:4-amino-4-deoxy-L-arabinose transferase-like glycosyltransferase
LRTALKKHFDFTLVAVVIAGFLLVAGQRLGTVPVPDTDESYMLQTSYEMLYRGNLALPFRRLLGGNIETNWHSFTPLHYVIQSGFLKIFGWGLLQGRVFNLIMSSLMLVMLYLIGRKLFGWQTGLIAVLLIVFDITFLERSRYLRNDYSAAAFALLAFYLYEVAERRKHWRWYIGCGLAAGAALMTHTVGFYMVLAIPVLMLLRRGWRALTTGGLYQYGIGALAVSAYEIISDVIDYKNVLLQNRGDRAHFGVLNARGLWRNIRHEPRRYYNWYDGGAMSSGVPRTLLHLIQLLAVIGICYLIVRAFVHLKRANARNEPRVRVLIVTTIAVVFFAVVAGRKTIYYMAHLAPWFALCASVFVVDALYAVNRLREARPGRLRAPEIAYSAALVLLLVGALGVGYLGFDQTRRYLRAARSPDQASFEEFTTALRNVVPEGVCPIAVREPVLWLAFPEDDLCFLNIQKRSKKAADIDGKEYAMIVAPKSAREWVDSIAGKNNQLVGRVSDTAYGSYEIYYTGVDPRWKEGEPVHYQFFGTHRGYVSDREIAGAREIWSADPTGLKQCGAPGAIEADGLAINLLDENGRRDGIVELCAVELKPDTIYQAALEGSPDAGAVSVAVLDAESGISVLDQAGPKRQSSMLSGLFRTGKNDLFKVAVRSLIPGDVTIKLTRITIREVAPVYR